MRLDARHPKFAAVVNGGNSWRGEEHSIKGVKRGRFPQLAGNARDIMVIHEIAQRQVLIDALRTELTVQAVSQFKVVVFVMRGMQSFIKLVIGGGMQRLVVGPLAIIPVNHFP